MSELFRSALSYLGGSGVGVGGGGSHDLVGQSVEVGGLKLRIRSLIAEGGFGLVFAAVDSSNHEYALKRLLAADREAADAILREIRFLRLLTGHPNIISYVQAASLSPQESGHGRAEYLVLTELCSGGPVVDALRNKTLNPEHVIRIFNATCQALKHMHLQEPPITHRDIKVENLLLDSRGFVKLCDFGSATTETFEPGPSWSATQRSQTEDEVARHTTPMYRSPELLDLWLDYPIGPPLDIWAVGCMLYYLCYRVHPFEDSAKLRIINANYSLPEQETPFTCFHPLIESTLQVDPRHRPGIIDLCESVEALAAALSVDLAAPCVDLLPPGITNRRQNEPAPRPPPPRPASPASNRPSPGAPPTAPERPAPPPPRPQPPKMDIQSRSGSGGVGGRESPSPAGYRGPPGAEAASGGGLLGSIRGSAGSLFKNLKESSAKVVNTVHASVSGKGVDLTYLTSRLGVGPIPDNVADGVVAPLEDQLRLLLEQRHRDQFAVYNLGTRKMRSGFGGRLSEVPLASSPSQSGRPPSLQSVFLICKNMALWLRQAQENVCILVGPEHYCSMLGAAFLIYCRLMHTPTQALELIASKRSRQHLPPSFLRYLDYTVRLSSVDPDRPRAHNRPLTLQSLRVEPLPLFNRARMGCKPFVEIWVSGDRALSTSQEYEKLRQYEYPENCLEVPLGVTVCGDVCIALFHARSTLGAKVQGRFAALPIFRVHFHTGLVEAETKGLDFPLKDLDETDDDLSKYQNNFRVVIDVRVAEKDRPFDGDPPAYLSHDPKSTNARLLVSGKEEKDSIARTVGSDKVSADNSPSDPRPTSGGEAGGKTEGFFSSLQWQTGDDGLPTAAPQPYSDDIPVSRSRDPSRSPLPHSPVGESHSSPAFHLPNKTPFLTTEEAYERAAGIRVSTGPTVAAEEEEFVPEEPTEIPEADLLNFGTDSGLSSSKPKGAQPKDIFDPFSQLDNSHGTSAQNGGTSGGLDFFADFGGQSSQPSQANPAPPVPPHQPTPPQPQSGGGDLLGDWSSQIPTHTTQPQQRTASPMGEPSFGQHIPNTMGGAAGLHPPNLGMHRNVSAPAFQSMGGGVGIPPGGRGMGGWPAGGFQPPPPQQNQWRPPPSGPAMSGGPGQFRPPMAGNRSGSTTPILQRPNYSRSLFEQQSGTAGGGGGGVGARPKVTENAFDDLLNSQGFSASKTAGNQTMGQMKRKEEIKDMDPNDIKIRDWIAGKERNIRALLGTLEEVVWEGCKWKQVAMSQLLTPVQIKKQYRLACLGVHPDKQTGAPHESLAKSVFTELNDAYTEYVNQGEPSF